jgi:hypothetical protein
LKLDTQCPKYVIVKPIASKWHHVKDVSYKLARVEIKGHVLVRSQMAQKVTT